MTLFPHHYLLSLNFTLHKHKKIHAGDEGAIADPTSELRAALILVSGIWVNVQRGWLISLLHPRKEESKNVVSLSTVIKGVLLQQALQAAVALSMFQVTSRKGVIEKPMQPSLWVQILQVGIAMFVMDTWQYFVHRYMHVNSFLYRHVHSQHHRLVVPYAIGALYNHPLEGLLLDTVGGAISFLVSGMTPKTSVFFFSFAVIKTVDDHCGLRLPGNPFHLLFGNNTAYHDIHHQLHGTKYNFSQPFFMMWDKYLGTYMAFTLVKRLDGGFEARPDDAGGWYYRHESEHKDTNGILQIRIV
ncbi:hypothetical protein GOP47_0008353 [Adiantum capillus-veneris]|uniref:Fatty acid hydroxylase domain-containing protein n=1 Tax=Adiantum capillus-veneris TaxID=13818 RepID=A0A9D4UYE5_ADICA|nr:hypothetical protein GOP47_0008353 [Adiantum capillus-veneris]